MKWTVKVVSETESGHTAEQTLVAVERPDQLTVEDLGLSLEEAKRLLATLQRSMVTDQIEEYGAAYRGCTDCHQLLHTKGYYQTSFRSAFGRVPLRVRRLVTCSCQGEPQETFACLPVHDGGLVAPEWLFLQAKLASLIPFARVADLLAMPRRSGVAWPGWAAGSTRRGSGGRCRAALKGETVGVWAHLWPFNPGLNSRYASLAVAADEKAYR
jgi:hypothetical protein